MPGAILHLGAVVICDHGGEAEPLIPNPTVLVSGMPIVQQESPYVIAGCLMPPPPFGDGPCVIGEWVLGSVTVLADGIPVLVQEGLAVCELSGTGLLPLVVQELVQAE